jgi:hypothetical protein
MLFLQPVTVSGYSNSGGLCRSRRFLAACR